MDLDGEWKDINGDGDYDSHTGDTEGDTEPEIFVSHIDTRFTKRGFESRKQLLIEYINKNIEFRTRPELPEERRALVYIDYVSLEDTEEVTEYLGYDNVDNLYEEIDLIDTDNDAYDYLDRLEEETNNYEWVHLVVHSTSEGHYFANGYVGTMAIMLGPSDDNPDDDIVPCLYPKFYFLRCCGAGNHVENSIGMSYIMSLNSKGLAVIGSTGTAVGESGIFDYFYTALSDDEVTIGEAFKEWFIHATEEGQPDCYYYLYTILGDPTLRLNHMAPAPDEARDEARAFSPMVANVPASATAVSETITAPARPSIRSTVKAKIKRFF